MGDPLVVAELRTGFVDSREAGQRKSVVGRIAHYAAVGVFGRIAHYAAVGVFGRIAHYAAVAR
jgi:hypothetical protein